MFQKACLLILTATLAGTAAFPAEAYRGKHNGNRYTSYGGEYTSSNERSRRKNDLNQQYNNLDQRKRQLDNEYEDLERQRRDPRNQGADKQRELTKRLREVDNEREGCRRQQQDIKVGKRNIDFQQEDYGFKQEQSTLERQETELSNRRQSLQRDLDREKNKSYWKRNGNKINRLENQLNQVDRDLEDCRGRKNTVKRQRDGIQRKYDDLDLAQEYNDLKETESKLKGRREQLKKELNEPGNKNSFRQASLQKEIEEVERNLRDCQGRKGRVRQERDDIGRQDLADLDEQERGLKSKRESIQDEIDAEEDKWWRHRDYNKINRLKQERDGVDQEIADCRAKKGIAQQRRDDFKKAAEVEEQQQQNPLGVTFSEGDEIVDQVGGSIDTEALLRVYGTVGYWSNPQGGDRQDIYWHGDENIVSWGNPEYQHQSGLGFLGTGVQDIQEGVAFDLGRLRHYNNVITGDATETVDLTLGLNFGDALPVQDFKYTFNIEETLNEHDVSKCEHNYKINDSVGCSDKIDWENALTRQTFELDGEEYELEIVGFKRKFQEAFTDEFITSEKKTNEAFLMGRINRIQVPDPTPVEVPEPAAALSLLAFGAVAAKLKCNQTN